MQLERATVTIVGVGLVGGSLGVSLAGRCTRRIGVVRQAAHVEAAREAGAVDEATTDLADAVERADLVVLAAPVGAIIELLEPVAEAARPGTVVTDVGSTKIDIVEAMSRLPAHLHPIGGHPMAGGTGHGPAAARAGLFDGAHWFLCPVRDKAMETAAALVTDMVAATGARAVTLAADVHDAACAQVSHLNSLVAHALVGANGRLVAEVPDAAGVAGPGLRSITALAAGDPAMWADILHTNRDQVRAALARLQAELDVLAATLDEREQLLARLASSRAARDALLAHLIPSRL